MEPSVFAFNAKTWKAMGKVRTRKSFTDVLGFYTMWHLGIFMFQSNNSEPIFWIFRKAIRKFV